MRFDYPILVCTRHRWQTCAVEDMRNAGWNLNRFDLIPGTPSNLYNVARREANIPTRELESIRPFYCDCYDRSLVFCKSRFHSAGAGVAFLSPFDACGLV